MPSKLHIDFPGSRRQRGALYGISGGGPGTGRTPPVTNPLDRQGVEARPVREG
ncbi:hypothetical protein [Sorangium sp. So ce861]|uniref:hypothetical protein n=1 Tax=Sorangium sp. So ce861 TaxID=3133323 RepID=UPI003F5E4C58